MECKITRSLTQGNDDLLILFSHIWTQTSDGAGNTKPLPSASMPSLSHCMNGTLFPARGPNTLAVLCFCIINRSYLFLLRKKKKKKAKQTNRNLSVMQSVHMAEGISLKKARVKVLESITQYQIDLCSIFHPVVHFKSVQAILFA